MRRKDHMSGTVGVSAQQHTSESSDIPASSRKGTQLRQQMEQKVFYCVPNEFVDNEFHSLTSCGQGLGSRARRLSASQGYGLSFISLLSVRLISRDTKGANPPWQQEIIWTTETHLCVDCFLRLRHQHRNQDSEVPREQIGVPEPTCGGLVKDLFIFHL